jgi:riboflavin biosynthesis pyrimidine reductase
MYDVMVNWETVPVTGGQPTYVRKFAAIWQAADKIVYSRTLETVSSARTRIERDFDPELVRELKATETRDVSIGGPELAAHAIKAGVVDEYNQFISPIMVGGGTPWLPRNARVRLRVLGVRQFPSGTVHLHYRQA